jgi:hypothetical protein
MQHWDLRGPDGDEHDRDGRDYGKACQKPQNDQRPARDLEHADEIRQKLRRWKSDLDEAARPQGVWEQELLDTLREENESNHESDQDNGDGRFGLEKSFGHDRRVFPSSGSVLFFVSDEGISPVTVRPPGGDVSAWARGPSAGARRSQYP